MRAAAQERWNGMHGGDATLPAADPMRRRAWWRPVPSAPSDLEEMGRAAETALASLNRHGAKVRARLDRRPAQALAELILEVTEPGVPGVLEQIEVMGLKRDTREALLTFLDLRPGMALPPSAPASIKHQLWSSARYLHHDVTLSPRPESGRFQLNLDLEEWTNAPAIGRALSAEDTARLKFREWLMARDRWTHDLVARCLVA